MATVLSPLELRMLRHYFTGSLAGDLVVDPDDAIAWCTGIVLQDGGDGENEGELCWTRIRQWVSDLPRPDRDVLIAAQIVYRQRHRDARNAYGRDGEHDLGVREAAMVRDAAFRRCLDATAQPALSDTPDQPEVSS